MVGLHRVADPGEQHPEPGHIAHALVQQPAQRQVEHDVAQIVAQAIDHLTNRAGLAGQPRQIAIGAIEHVPAHVQAKADQRPKRPARLGIGKGSGDHAKPADHRNHVRRQRRAGQSARQLPCQWMVKVIVERILKFARPFRFFRHSAPLQLPCSNRFIDPIGQAATAWRVCDGWHFLRGQSVLETVAICLKISTDGPKGLHFGTDLTKRLDRRAANGPSRGLF